MRASLFSARLAFYCLFILLWTHSLERVVGPAVVVTGGNGWVWRWCSGGRGASRDCRARQQEVWVSQVHSPIPVALAVLRARQADLGSASPGGAGGDKAAGGCCDAAEILKLMGTLCGSLPRLLERLHVSVSLCCSWAAATWCEVEWTKWNGDG